MLLNRQLLDEGQPLPEQNEQNKVIVRRYFGDFLNGARVDAVDEIMTQDCVFTAPVI